MGVREDKMKRALVTVALLAGVFCIAQTSTVQHDDSARKESAVALVRLINTAEALYRVQKGTYGDFQQLAGTDLLHTKSVQFANGEQFNAANPTEPLPGLHLNLAIAAGGNGYQTSVVVGGHDWGFYSDQDAVIFEMHPIR
jgi:hypothetical protein